MPDWKTELTASTWKYLANQITERSTLLQEHGPEKTDGNCRSSKTLEPTRSRAVASTAFS